MAIQENVKQGFPIRMKYRLSPQSPSSPKDVYVYSFRVVSEKRADALCWFPSSAEWMTIPVVNLVPILPNILNEERR